MFRRYFHAHNELAAAAGRRGTERPAATLNNDVENENRRNPVAAAAGGVPRSPFDEKFPTAAAAAAASATTRHSTARRPTLIRQTTSTMTTLLLLLLLHNTPRRSPTPPLFYIHTRHIRNTRYLGHLHTRGRSARIKKKKITTQSSVPCGRDIDTLGYCRVLIQTL